MSQKQSQTNGENQGTYWFVYDSVGWSDCDSLALSLAEADQSTPGTFLELYVT